MPTHPLKWRSAALTDGDSRAPARAMLRATGLTDDDLRRPLIGVANTWIEIGPCNYHLRDLAGAPPGEEIGDGELLDRFIAARDETAFAALVHRHGGMVWHVCRRSLGNEHDADDVFQATFLLLARKAASIRKLTAVASWLQGSRHGWQYDCDNRMDGGSSARDG